MTRFLVLSVALVSVTACGSHTVHQRGTVTAPRVAHDDGQPMRTPYRLEVHGGTFAADPTPSFTGAALRSAEDGGQEAVARHQAGGSVRARISDTADVVVEAEGAWSPRDTTVEGAPIAAPERPVMSLTTGLRMPKQVTEGLSIGLAFDLGVSLVPIQREIETETTSGWDVPRPITTHSSDLVTDPALLARATVVPSYRAGRVTVFGAVGVASETVVPGVVTTDGGDGPGAEAGIGGAAVVAAAGATVELGEGGRLMARVGDAFSMRAAGGNYGPQVDVGLSFDLDR